MAKFTNNHLTKGKFFYNEVAYKFDGVFETEDADLIKFLSSEFWTRIDGDKKKVVIEAAPEELEEQVEEPVEEPAKPKAKSKKKAK